MHTETTTCCVVGGGPAGRTAGLLLARAGVEVTVLEKHQDSFRDFAATRSTRRLSGSGRFIGMGVRPERVQTGAVTPLDASGDRR